MLHNQNSRSVLPAAFFLPAQTDHVHTVPGILSLDGIRTGLNGPLPPQSAARNPAFHSAVQSRIQPAPVPTRNQALRQGSLTAPGLNPETQILQLTDEPDRPPALSHPL